MGNNKLELVVDKKGRILPIIECGQQTGQVCIITCTDQNGLERTFPLWGCQCDKYNVGDYLSTVLPKSDAPFYLFKKTASAHNE